MAARRNRRINSSLFPENMGPQIASIQPELGIIISKYTLLLLKGNRWTVITVLKKGAGRSQNRIRPARGGLPVTPLTFRGSLLVSIGCALLSKSAAQRCGSLLEREQDPEQIGNTGFSWVKTPFPWVITPISWVITGMFSTRVIGHELLDEADPEEARTNLADLVRINRKLGGHASILKMLASVAERNQAFTVLDVGAASGDTAALISAHYPFATIISLDRNQTN